jgi:hypothetical protein
VKTLGNTVEKQNEKLEQVISEVAKLEKDIKSVEQKLELGITDIKTTAQKNHKESSQTLDLIIKMMQANKHINNGQISPNFNQEH